MLPEKWAPTELEQLATFKSGGTPSKQHPEYWNGGSLRWKEFGKIRIPLPSVHEQEISNLNEQLENLNITLPLWLHMPVGEVPFTSDSKRI